MPDVPLSRRHALTGAAVAGIGLPLLVACGDDAADPGAGNGTPTPATSPSSPSESATPDDPVSSEQTSQPAQPPADALVATAEVPNGGGRVLKQEKLVVTQPSAGEFRCFTAVCTHRGCIVANVEGGTINCTCHGSRFSIDDGSVVNGPATTTLAEVAVVAEGGSVIRA
jgi:Rieske Fe-S protein